MHFEIWQMTHLEWDKISYLKKWFETQNKYSGISLREQKRIHIVFGSVYELEMANGQIFFFKFRAKIGFYAFHTRKVPTKIKFSCPADEITRTAQTDTESV